LRSTSEAMAHDIRRIVLDCSKCANVGHIGSALSVADLIAALYAGPLMDASPEDPDRDRFILSKGHAALALYGALALSGVIEQRDLDRFCVDGSPVGVHPEHSLRGIDFATGSLGQGLCMAAGAALAARLQGSRRRVFVLLSDAECNEGSVWEAAMFAAHHRLGNLIAVVDANGQQALGATSEVLNTEPLTERWATFGWAAQEADGHDHGALNQWLSSLDTDAGGPPHVLIARTVFGNGVSYMEGNLKWHYWPMSDPEYGQALADIGTTRAGGVAE
jgi:transketolase